MPTTTPHTMFCPFCHTKTSVAPAQTTCYDSMGGQVYYDTVCEVRGDTWWIATCNHCGRPVLVLNSAEIIYPEPRPAPSSEHIPDAIRSDLDEAKMCVASGCDIAATIMARRSIEAAVKGHGAQGKNLKLKIDDLADKGIITEGVKNWAHELRFIGNDAAHEEDPSISADEASEAVALAEDFLDIVYVKPERAAEMKATREAKKAAKKAGQ